MMLPVYNVASGTDDTEKDADGVGVLFKRNLPIVEKNAIHSRVGSPDCDTIGLCIGALDIINVCLVDLKERWFSIAYFPDSVTC